MPYFLYEGRLECGQEAELTGKEAAHASKSRRLREGEIFEVQDEQPQRFEAKVLENARNQLSFIVENRLEPPTESPLKLELWQALPREKALEMILQKGTELGVSNSFCFRVTFPRECVMLQSSKMHCDDGKEFVERLVSKADVFCFQN